MKRIINGRMYNTETAVKVADFFAGSSAGDFSHFGEELYRKKTGEWFLYGYGGPMSCYAVSYGSETSGSSEIMPYTEKEAKAWLEENGFVDEYIKYFGEPEE